MYKYLLALMICLVTTVSFAGPIEAPEVRKADRELYLRVVVETTVDEGAFIVVDARDTNAKTIQWRVSPGTTYRVFENGRVAICGTGGSKIHKFMVIAVKDNDVIIKEYVISVVQPSKFQSMLHPIIQSEYLKIISKYREDDAEKLANVFKSLALQVRSGEITDIQDLMTRTKNTNKAVLGDRVEVWTPLLLVLGEKLQSLSENGDLPDSESLFDVWLTVHNSLMKLKSDVERDKKNGIKQTTSISGNGLRTIRDGHTRVLWARKSNKLWTATQVACCS